MSFLPKVEMKTNKDPSRVPPGELGLYPGKTFLYLFDYGDEWEFKVEVEEISSDRPLPLTPKIVGKRGEAPDQYGYG